jgi:hypothetical protein
MSERIEIEIHSGLVREVIRPCRLIGQIDGAAGGQRGDEHDQCDDLSYLSAWQRRRSSDAA